MNSGDSSLKLRDYNQIETKYILVTWPEIQDFMTEERWNECIFCTKIKDHPCPDCAYMVPEDLYKEVYMKNIH